MSEAIRSGNQTAKLAPAAAPPAARPGAGTSPLRDTTELQGAAKPPEPSLSELVSRARAAAAAPASEAAPATKAAPAPDAPSLAIPGVPTGQNLPVTVKAAITVNGTARVNRMTEDSCEIRLSVKGKALFMTVERDVTVSLTKRPDGSYLYRYKDEKSGDTDEGVATDIQVDGNVRKLNVKDAKSGETFPVTITDMGGGRFKIAGDGFEADINKV